jgi:hypothetical protein
MKPRRNRVKTNRATTHRVYRKKSKTRKHRKHRRGGTCEDTNQRVCAIAHVAWPEANNADEVLKARRRRPLNARQCARMVFMSARAPATGCWAKSWR